MPWTQPPLKRACPCNGDLLLYLRERKGLTQVELAGVAGFSERLINKAESGKSISTDTIDVLAGALSTNENPIFPEDLICDALALAKEFIANFYTQQVNFVSAVRHFLDEEIVFHFSGDPEIIPFAGTHHGIDGLQRFAEGFFSILQTPVDHDHEPWYKYFVQGNDVIALGESWIHPIGAPMEKPIKVSNHLKFRKGKLIAFDDLYDTRLGGKMVSEFLDNS